MSGSFEAGVYYVVAVHPSGGGVEREKGRMSERDSKRGREKDIEKEKEREIVRER